MAQNKLVIAIDGPGAAGKSTVAKIIAKKLNYTYIDIYFISITYNI